jgi:uncharacterized integral membrane protein
VKPEEEHQELSKADKIAIARAAVILAILILFIVFVAQNSDPVNVSFIFGDANIRLIWVFLGCGAIGAVVGWLVRERWHAWRRRPKK